MKSYLSFIILVLTVVGIIFISGCVQQPVEERLIKEFPVEEEILPTKEPVKVSEKEAKPKVLDADGDGVPDNEDDYPTDPIYRAKLEVTKINWYIDKNPMDPRPIVVFEYRNNKPYDLYWVTPYATIRRADGVIIKTYYSTWGDINADILKPGEKCYAWVPFGKDLAGLIASAEGEVKGESRSGIEKEGDIKDLNIEIESHNGSYDPDKNAYRVSGIVKNNGDEAETINIYIGFFAADGTILDVGEVYQVHIPAGERAMFSTPEWQTSTPEANKISTYEFCITRD